MLIVGGGITGASLACALSQSQYFESGQDDDLKKIVLLDHTKLPSINSYKPEKRIPEPRVITLSPNSLRFLNSIGALQICNENYLTPFYHMLVYEEAGRGYMKFDLKAQKEKC